MRSGMTAGKFAAFMVAALMVIGSALCVSYEAWTMAGALFICGIVLGGWVIVDAIWERHNDELDDRRCLVESRTRFAVAVGSLDSETRQFMSLEWPELGVDFGIEPIIYLLDNGMNTNILLACLQKFLQDSSEQEFADVRKYNDDKYLQQTFGLSRDAVRKQWQLATQFLMRKEYLVPGSMAGSHSYQWKTKGHYRQLARRYVAAKSVASLGSDQPAMAGG